MEKETSTPAFVGTCDIPLGTRIRSLITGDIGIVTEKYYQLSGCIMFGAVSPTVKDSNNRPLKYYPSLQHIEVLDGRDPVILPQPKEESNFRLGERVEVPVYGITEGTVVAIAFSADTSTHIEIQPPYNAERGVLPSALSVPEFYVISLEHEEQAPTEAAKRPSPPMECSPQGVQFPRR